MKMSKMSLSTVVNLIRMVVLLKVKENSHHISANTSASSRMARSMVKVDFSSEMACYM